MSLSEKNALLPYQKVLAAFCKINPDYVVHQSVLNEIYDRAAHPEKPLHNSPSYPGPRLVHPISKKPMKSKGRPHKKSPFRIAILLADEYWRATGKRPSINVNAYTEKASGRFYELVQKIFDALDVKANAEHMAREAGDLFIKIHFAQKMSRVAIKTSSKVARNYKIGKAMEDAYLKEARKHVDKLRKPKKHKDKSRGYAVDLPPSFWMKSK